jgi:hypothetical protein
MDQEQLLVCRVASAANGIPTACGIFEHSGERHFLTPPCVQRQREDELSLDFKDQPNSWLVQLVSEEGAENEAKIVIEKGYGAGSLENWTSNASRVYSLLVRSTNGSSHIKFPNSNSNSKCSLSHSINM